MCVCVWWNIRFLLSRKRNCNILLYYHFDIVLTHTQKTATSKKVIRRQLCSFQDFVCSIDLINHFVESNRIGDALEILCGKKCVVWTRPMTWWLSRQSPNTPTRKFDQPINRYDKRANYVFLYYLSSFYSFTGLEKKKIEKKDDEKRRGKKSKWKKKKNRNWETKIMGEK